MSAARAQTTAAWSFEHVADEIRGPLERICERLDGALAATVMGVDGLTVDSVAAGPPPVLDTDVESLLVEYSSLLGQVQRSAQMFAAGRLEELTIASEHLTTLIRPLTGDYFVALTIGPTASVGKGRYLLRVHARELSGVLA